MSFVNRLFSYVFDELMVNALANSRTFQRFAVRSDAFVKDAAKGETMEAAKRAAEEASRRAEAAARTVFEQGRSGGSSGGGKGSRDAGAGARDGRAGARAGRPRRRAREREEDEARSGDLLDRFIHDL